MQRTKVNYYVALLRGINVGGKNIIKMDTLRKYFEESGFKNVTTYIQSGNVLFGSKESNTDKLTNQVETMLFKLFDKELPVVVLSLNKLEETVTKAPRVFGTRPKEFKYDVIFLKKPLAAKTALSEIKIKEDVDEVYAGKDVLYFSRLTSKLTQSKLSKIVSLPIYKNMTIRNWNTTSKLLALLTSKVNQ